MDESRTPGELLRRGREARGLTVADVSERTKIPPRLVEAIERDEYHKLSGDLYVKSFLRAYAGCVGLEASDLLARFERAAASAGDGPVSSGPAPAADVSSPPPPAAPPAPARASSSPPPAGGSPLVTETAVRRVTAPWPVIIGVVLVVAGVAGLLVWWFVFAGKGG